MALNDKKRRFHIGLLGICLGAFFVYVCLWVWLIVFSTGLRVEQVEVVNVPEEVGSRYFGKSLENAQEQRP